MLMSNELLETEQAALKLLEKGSLVQAKKILEELVKKKHLAASGPLKKATKLLCRRYWMQGKEEFLKEANEPELFFAKAKFQGIEAVRAFAQSSHPDACLARALLEPTTKKGLLYLRQIPHFTDLAEGWLALIKKDLEKARLSFQKAAALQPKRAALALAIVDRYEGNFEQKNHFFFSLSKEQFPLTSQLLNCNATLTSREISHLFYHAKPEVLQFLLSKLDHSQKKEKGWFHLRLGDLQYAQLSIHAKPSSEILFHWEQAVKFYPPLKLDVLKRTFISYKNSEDYHLFYENFQQLYFFCERKNKKLASSFLEEVIFNESFHN